jgi:hypothetical protein
MSVRGRHNDVLPQSRPRSGTTERRCACGGHVIAGGECEQCRRRRSAEPRPSAPLRAPVGDVPVRSPSGVVGGTGARAASDADGIHLAAGAADLPQKELDALLAHESVHAEQRRSGRRTAAAEEVELEAHRLAPEALAGRPVEPRLRPQPGVVLFDTPAEQAAVAAARKRLALLEQYVREWEGREARRIHTPLERDPLLEKRKKIEGAAALGGERGEIEAERMAKLNRAPLEIAITEDEIKFKVKFHVRFEDPTMEPRFGALKAGVLEGIRAIWTQTLKGELFGGRRFAIEPQFTLVSPKAARDTNYWLITVRPKDDPVATYERCTFDPTTPGLPTSVTDPLCDGGVMSIPPLHITKPDVLGHELLHLFGFLDRYLLLTSGAPGKPEATEVPLRDTSGRPDPLGSQKGKILAEDVAFLFDRLGVYEMEENRDLDALRDLEKKGLTIYDVRAEIMKQRDIIDRGGKRETLIKERKDFRDKVLQSVEDL